MELVTRPDVMDESKAHGESEAQRAQREMYSELRYPSLDAEHKERYEAHRLRVYTLLGIDPTTFFRGKTVLDAGCGTGEETLFLASLGPERIIGIDTSDPDLRPRVRVRVTVQYVSGASNTIEFLDGSDIIQGTVQTAAGTQENPLVPNALTENDLSNVVGVCDILAVQPDASVEVFVPVFLKVIQVVETEFTVERGLERTIPPQFTVLRSDDVDENNNVTLQRNFDVRDIPVQVTNVQCGSVVGFTLSGTLRVPFVEDELGQVVPGWEDTDFPSEASSPGRFEFQTAVR